MLPNSSLLAQIPQRILNIPNQRKESKRTEHYGLFLLCYEAGLRVSEAINFDLSTRTKKGLYKITKTKGKRERLAYIPKKVIKELKKYDWKPNQTNRFNFYHFLRKIKRELNLPVNIELTPHTLRRAFATYQAENGLPLPLLQKLLGHASIRTTALYWLNIYNDGGNDTDDILAGKFWPKKPRWKSKPESKTPINLNLDESPELLMENSPQPLANKPHPDYLSKIKHLKEKLTQIRGKKAKKITELESEKKTLQTDLAELSKQNTNLQHELSEKDQIIKKLTQDLATEREQKNIAENNLVQEREISHTQKQTINDLNQQLISKDKTIANLQNAYQNAIKDKQIIELSAQREKQKADSYEQQLKSIAQMLYQWQKLNYYKQLEKQNEFKAQIIQSPPWRNK